MAYHYMPRSDRNVLNLLVNYIRQWLDKIQKNNNLILKLNIYLLLQSHLHLLL